MKKATFIVSALLLLSAISMVSCKKRYHCSCTFRNEVVLYEDMGLQTERTAKDKCNSYDTTIPGEVWTCTIF